MLKAGDIVDRYTVEGEIASGGMAEVYRVRHQQLGSVHALKVLVLRTKDIRRRLLQEGRVQAALNHPNAIMVTDVVEVDGHPGLVMEYVDGPTLGDWVHLDNPSYAEIERVFRAVVSAIGEAHRVGLIHRDLKPSNVLLARAGEKRIPKVIDFGLAKVVEEDNGEEDHTRTGVPMGTPSYMAPEQIADAKNVDPRADIFSLGVLLYYMCCKRKAFAGGNAVETYNAVLAGQFTPPEEIRPDIPETLKAAIYACMRTNRNERVSTTEDLIAILDGVVAPKKPEPVAWKVPAALGLAGVLVLVVGYGLANVDSTGTKVEYRTYTPELEVVGAGLQDSPRRTAHGPDTPVPHGTAPSSAFCGARPGQVLGYALVPARARRGETWTFEAPAPLTRRAAGPSAGCILPTGTTIRLVEKPVKVSGELWVPVFGDAFQLP
ncbi:MAG: serine/threonine-protein kinase [Myxococcota bacterium]